MKLLSCCLILLSEFAVSDAFTDLLKRGRRADYPSRHIEVPQKTSSNRGVIAQRSNGDYITYVMFNTRKSPTVDSTQEYSQILAILETFDFQVGDEDYDLDNASVIEFKKNLFTVTIPRTYNGFRVKDAYMEVTFKKFEDLFHFRSIRNRTYGDISMEPVHPLIIDKQVIEEITQFRSVTLLETENVVFPLKDTFVFSQRVEFLDDNSLDRFEVYISLSDKTLLQAHSFKVYESLKGEVYERSYLGKKAFYPFPHTKLEIDGDEVITKANGSFSGSASGDVSVTLSNKRVSVHKYRISKPYVLEGTLSRGLKFDNIDDLRAANSFVSINRINAYTREYIKEDELDFLSSDVKLTFSINNQSCNAFYNGDISLFGAGGGCADMAEANDVIYHEWGHGLDRFTGRRGGMQDGAFSEGIGDILAAYYTGSSNMGAGFFQGKEKGIRELNNSKKYPQDQGEVHDEGLIIGGAFWDLRELLIERYGEIKGKYIAGKFFFRHLMLADNYRESFDLVMDLDDDDNNLATPSPNKCLIIEAFKNHGLSSESTCEDEVKEDKVGVDSSVFVYFDGSKIHVSSDQARELYACEGESFECDEKIEFSVEGKKDKRIIFSSTREATISEHDIYTIVSLSESGDVVGKRLVKVVTQ